ncbi:adenosylcobinamide-GDP ribazoletransferase [Alphaproteobacteria bacterium]|nr:adenosylcobinamide-GDP ribazoletransferase [Alphaproteobacteria bacterium]
MIDPATPETSDKVPSIINRLKSDLGAAFLMLSVIPVFWHRFDDDKTPNLAPALWAFPVVGIVLGIIVGCFVQGGDDLGLPPMLAAIIGIMALVMVTGAMHEDGIADTADGFGGGRSPERKAEIMHDSSIGSYGVMALVLSTAARVTILVTLMDMFYGWTFILMMAAIIAGARYQVLILLHFFKISPYAKLANMAGAPHLSNIVAGLAIWAGLMWMLTSLTTIIVAGIMAFLSTIWLGRLATRQINGLNGDVMGASIIIGEIVIGTAVIIAAQLANG